MVEGKSKKPEVEDYTCELWSGANFRILNHLIRIGTPSHVLGAYCEYSSWIADFLEIYIPRVCSCLMSNTGIVWLMKIDHGQIFMIMTRPSS